MRKLTSEAMGLLKKFSVDASCNIDWKHPEHAMFYPSCDRIAERKGLPEITVEVIREYILKNHNRILFRRYRAGNLNAESVKGCMVYAKEVGGKFFAYHKNTEVMEITNEETESLRQRTDEILESLQ